MASELAADLAEAAADGTPGSAIAGDPEALARAWAVERNLVRGRRRIVRVVVAAIVGLLPGVGLALFFVFGVASSEAFARLVGTRADANGRNEWVALPGWLMVAVVVVGVAVGIAGALAAVDWMLRIVEDPARGRTVRLLALSFPVTAATGFGLASAYGAHAGYSFGRRVIAGEITIGAAVVCVGVVGARTLARRAAGAPSERSLEPSPDW